MSTNKRGSREFALIQYEGSDSYYVIDMDNITKNKQGQTIAKHAGSKYLATVVHKSVCEIVLKDLAYNINNKCPCVELNNLKNLELNKQLSEDINCDQNIIDSSPTITGQLENGNNCDQNVVILQDHPTVTGYFENEIGCEQNVEILQGLVLDGSPTVTGHLENEIKCDQNIVILQDLVLNPMVPGQLENGNSCEEYIVMEQGLTQSASPTVFGYLENGVSCEENIVMEQDFATNKEQKENKAELDKKVIKVDMRSLAVPNSSDKNKRYFCVYCEKKITNFGRHLLTMHKKEGDVIQILKYPQGHPERSILIGKIRKRGQFLYNTTDVNTGTLMISRRPSEKRSRTANHFVVCPYCKAMYSKLSIRVHTKKCSENTAIQKTRNHMIESRKCVSHIHSSAVDRLARDVFPKCRRDHITELMAYDELCVLYGNKLVNKFKDQRYNPMIRSRLRTVGTFLYEFMKSNPTIKCLREILDPSNYDQIVDVTNRIAGLDETGHYKAPSTAYALGLQLKTIVTMYESQCIKEKSKEKRAAARDLLTLMNEGFQVDINKTVMENQSERQRQKKIKLPTKEDIAALKHYLNEGVKAAYLNLSKSVTLANWKELAGFTLISLQLFNRRRAGEIERILIKDFHSYEFVNENDDAFQSMQTNLKQLATLYGRFFIRGKLNRQVPVLVNRDMITYINVLLQQREAVGVLVDNPYVFGIPGSSQHHLRACNLIRKYSTECGAPNPETLRGTELRKQIATACTLYNLPDLMVDDVAKHLGHHPDIHRNIYRQSTANQIPSMVNILRKALGDSEDEEVNQENEELPPSQAAAGTSSSQIPSFSKNIIIEEQQPLTEVFNNDLDYVPSRSPTPELKAPKKRTSWSEEEKSVIFKSLESMIQDNVLPTYQQCMELKARSPCLEKRTPPQIKAFVAYQSQRLTKVGTRSYWSSEEKQVVRKNFKVYLSTKTLPSLPFCKQIINDNPVLKSRTPEMLKAFINNMNKKKRRSS